jgi:hypothetical protein
VHARAARHAALDSRSQAPAACRDTIAAAAAPGRTRCCSRNERPGAGRQDREHSRRESAPRAGRDRKSWLHHANRRWARRGEPSHPGRAPGRAARSLLRGAGLYA